MMHHPAIAQQIAAERQRDMLDQADRQRLARTARTGRAARTARPATQGPSGPYLLRRAYAALTSH